MAMNENSREALRLQKEEEQQPEKQDKIRLRLIPIWLRVLIVFVLILFSIMAGAAVGYGVLGDGNALDVFNRSTWTHLLDLVEKK
ncbi:DNA-directed RNA polymerase subunit beta [Niallia sp. XMNu-256]|uniref:DNA-directed RNA polymerase subunit beta n=1 Tax=Niallia sp. XMNu-256 TaxID=3082444 RepID=UPI0030D06A39